MSKILNSRAIPEQAWKSGFFQLYSRIIGHHETLCMVLHASSQLFFIPPSKRFPIYFGYPKILIHTLHNLYTMTSFCLFDITTKALYLAAWCIRCKNHVLDEDCVQWSNSSCCTSYEPIQKKYFFLTYNTFTTLISSGLSLLGWWKKNLLFNCTD